MTPPRYIRRRVLGLTQGQLAEKLGVAQHTISRWETVGLFPARYMVMIRELAEQHGTRWDDRLFFEVPADKAPSEAA